MVGEATPERMCAWAARSARRVDTGLRVRRADDRRGRADAHAAADRQHREALRREERTTSTATTSPAARSGEAAQGGGQARGRARRDAVRPARRRAARAGRALGRRVAVRRRAAATPSGCAASRTRWRCCAGSRRTAPRAPTPTPRCAPTCSASTARRARAYRRYAERLADYNCSFAAALHNATSAAQRRAAVKKLKGYEDRPARARRRRGASACRKGRGCRQLSAARDAMTRCGLLAAAVREVLQRGAEHRRQHGRHRRPGAFAFGARLVERLAGSLVADQDRDFARVVRRVVARPPVAAPPARPAERSAEAAVGEWPVPGAEAAVPERIVERRAVGLGDARAELHADVGGRCLRARRRSRRPRSARRAASSSTCACCGCACCDGRRSNA